MIGIKPGSTDALTFPKPVELDAVSRTVLGLYATDDPYTAVRELRTDATLLIGAIGPIQ